ncbi:MAG: arsenate reductase ArsC [bacterium]|nr:arsenate reductase ArsC [bacterium]MDD5756627.1 arsenate reductase ArsC [bacterium]
MAKIPILFVCVHNSARSQMAEAFMNKLANDKFIAESAGLEPGVLNPLVIEVMKEIGIDISQNQTKSVMDFFKQGKLYRYVITVCDEGAAQKCPLFPGVNKTIHWSFADPAGFTGSWEEKLQKTREVRDQIKAKIETFIKEISAHD